MKSETKAWVKKAEEDLNLALYAFKSREHFYNSVCFHAQQSCEKYLKGVLQEKGRDIPKTHDMRMLVEAVSEFIPDISVYKNRLVSLTAYAVAARYPFEDAEKKDAEKALEISEICRKIVRKNMGYRKD